MYPKLRRTLLASGLILALAMPAVQAADAEPRTVNVSGQGEVRVMPDRAQLHLGVNRIDPDLRNAQKEVDAVVRNFLVAARKLGIPDAHLDSTGASIQPEYVWDDKARNNRLVGYRVRRDIRVQVDRLDQLGELILSATQAGANEVQAPELEYSKAREIQRQALVGATLDARERAELLARTLGMKLGPVRQLNASESGPPQPMPKLMAMRTMADDSGNADMGLNAGELRYQATVNAEFELIAP